MKKPVPKSTSKRSTNRTAVQTSFGDEWCTPPEIVELARAFFGGIDTDPATNAAAQKRIRAKRPLTKDDDGLKRPWSGNVLLNPPFSRGLIDKFVDKLLEELASGRVTAAIMIVNNCADTAWFRKAARAAAMICFPQGRIKFLKPDGTRAGSPPRGQALLYFGPDPEGFKQAFRQLGLVGKLQRRKMPSRWRRLRALLGRRR